MTDFFTGFEGELEICFVESGEGDCVDTVRIWEGYFDELMGLLVPGQEGWSGLALHYNLLTGWHDALWRLPDLNEAIAEWRTIPLDEAGAEARNVHAAVLHLLEHAQIRGHIVSIECL